MLQRERDVRGGTSADCYKEKVMSEEGLQLSATKRRSCQRRDFSLVLQRERDVRGTSADCYKEKVMSEEGLQLSATKRRSCQRRDFSLVLQRERDVRGTSADCYKEKVPQNTKQTTKGEQLGIKSAEAVWENRFSKVCFSKHMTSRVRQVEAIEEETSSDIILTVQAVNTSDAPKCSVLVEGTPIRVLVDSGSTYTILPESLYTSTFNKFKLQPSDIAPRGYGGSPITIQGYLHANIQDKKRSTPEKIYVSEKGTAILGWPTQKKLNIILNSTLSQPVLQTTANLVEEYPDVFEQNESTVKRFKHQIIWKETPVQHKVRNIPLSIRPALTKELQCLQDEGIIEPIEASEGVSPIVVAKKPGVCVDLHDVNNKIVVETHPMPNIHDARAFTSLDLRSAYHQIPLTEDSRSITAFITPDGLFRYTRVPFGLASAAALFQRLMHWIFKDVDGVCYFQDDILVYAPTREKHDEILRVVLQKL